MVTKAPGERRAKVKQKVDRALLRVANSLTASRLLATPFVVYLLLETAQRPELDRIILVLLVVLQATDVLDGYIARRAQGQLRVNPAGEMLDPIADKLYLNSSFVTLAVIGRVEVWVAAVIVMRDVLILLGWLLRYIRSGVRTLPNVLGKMADSSQALLLFAILIGPSALVLKGFAFAAVGLTVLSGLVYARAALLSDGPAQT